MQMQYLHGVATLRIDASKCIGCDLCMSVCPHRVIEIRGRKAVVRDLDSCMECGACRENCPVGAVEVDVGVGCAHAIIRGMFTGTPPECGCSAVNGGVRPRGWRRGSRARISGARGG